MRLSVAVLAVVGGLVLVGGAAADTGPLPAPLVTDSFYTWPGAQLLQVSPVPWGGGYVRSASPYYVDCPLACIRPFSVGATVTLTAVPSTGYKFVGWQVADHGQPPVGGACPGTGTCTVTISTAKDVVALFDGPPPQPVGEPDRNGSNVSKAKTDCQKFGGTFAKLMSPILWACNGWINSSLDDFIAKSDTLSDDCFADGGDGYGASGILGGAGQSNCFKS